MTQEPEGGVALVIVLAFVVLLTVAVVAFFSRTTVERQVANSSANVARSDTIALSALDVIVGDLKQEIVDGSTPGAGTPAVYEPLSPANIVPQRGGTPAPGTSPIPNLVRVSAHDDATGSTAIPVPGGSSRASDASSSNSSSNGRAVTLARWNSHYLVPRLTTTTTLDSTPIATFRAPDWVLLSRNGPARRTTLGTGATALNNAAPSNDNFVIGRYAYAIYDEGGLLDINIAGYPSGTTPIQVGAKTNLGFVDLSAIIGTTASQLQQIDNIVGWRNFASIRSEEPSQTQPAGTLFGDYSFNAAGVEAYLRQLRRREDGFVRASARPYPSPVTAASRTDQTFATRQDLLRYRRLTALSQNVLEYVATFSRDTTTPSYKPPSVTATNPNFLATRATGSFTRFDGTMATAGEPLVKTRFPLDRLTWITPRGPSASLAATDPIIIQLKQNNISDATIAKGTAANILACFGLTYISPGGVWTYSHGAADRILRLSEVAAANREPDFFELLQASIQTGSLGQSSGGGVTGSNATVPVFPDVHMSNTTHHLLSIGASIIDQSDFDSFPTNIRFSSGTALWTAYGVESLPYITQLHPIAGISPADPSNWAIFLLFQLWNPHIGQPLSPVAPPVRLRVDGDIGVFTGGNGQTYTAANPRVSATGQNIVLSATALAPQATPTALRNPDVVAAPPSGSAAAPCGFESLPGTATGTAINNYVGLRLLPDFRATAAPSGSNRPQVTLYLGAESTHRFNATLEYDAGGGTWVPYNHFTGINDPVSWIYGATLPVRTANNLGGTPSATVDQFNTGRLDDLPPAVLMKADPRATRFGIFQLFSATSRITESLWPPGQANGYGGAINNSAGPVAHAPMRFSGGGFPYYPATLSINTTASTNLRTGYVDADSVIRPADAAYPIPTNNAVGSSTPYYATNSNYKPVMLNRPFRAAGELGYSFRDLPWKSLDLFTDKSGDPGILDVFTVTEEPAVVGGRVNLNTRQAPVVQAILAGTIWNELDSTDTIARTGTTATASETIAQRLVSETSSTPLVNRASLVSQSGLPLNVLPLPTGSTFNQTVKSRREAVVRALSTVGQTRTWNLMVDVIAQAGRYPPTATTLDQFVVEGEKRYWLHIAVDRFTGEVIDQQLEPVYE